MRVLFFFYLGLKEFLRQPMYVLTSIVFPAMFFWFFGIPNAKDLASATLLMGSFSAFAVLGVVLFQLAVHTSGERSSPWSRYLQTLPVHPLELMLAKVAASFVLSFLAIAMVVSVALLATDFSYSQIPWGPFLGALIVGGIPFALMALVIGYHVQGKAALPFANMIYLPLSFAGGLWLPPNALPQMIQDISEYLPTRMYGEWIWAVLFEKPWPKESLKGLALYAVAFMLVFLFSTQWKRHLRTWLGAKKSKDLKPSELK